MPTRRRPAVPPKPTLSVRQVLEWADNYYSRWGRWPNRDSGRIPGTDETWSAVDGALFQGHRGLPRGGSLIKVLAEYRGYRHRNYLPRLRVNDILAWADAHRERTGEWPTERSGPVAEAPGETWSAIGQALARRTRGLRRRNTLAGLLARRRGRRHATNRPDLTVEQVMAWAEAHHTLFGMWPTLQTGPVGSTGETWHGIDRALRSGRRGLPGGSSLFRLLKKHGKIRGDYTPYRRGVRRP